ncbi:DUF6151 family protein [Undibacterium flavidum]|uniref:CENP-V/GFA domain-containing protein n=1 Tax=Undibacterium flavidum TaxID=2762297 RepID=A0ABR6Y8P2_9BURK|nr:DUF6151 family protein [Undibacterium flavidum]MBC3872948.1 hypothetical protein [Undibacterium flavidum]
MHTIQCQCGEVRAHLEGEGTHNHIVCYCTDCRAFAHFLGRGEQVLDAQGGTEIVQVSQARLRFVQGREHLAAVRLSDKGMVRWYAACCKTPLGNVMLDPKMAFIGLIHSALDKAHVGKDFGSVTAWMETQAALGEPKPVQKGVLPVVLRFMGMTLSARLSGSYKKSPLFNAEGRPVAQAEILTHEQLMHLKSL